ncbi:MAG: GTP-binding protein [Ruminococcaceae bacterium]|nr:GTP-binding protein [Oscillospiraceae bacterium]
MAKKHTVIGILAHVDAGKTTLSEAMLYLSGTRTHLGRVDKRDSFLDTHTIERERGITVFSKQATLSLSDTDITLIDTPGHVDFSCETERALSVQDYAILVVSAQDGPTPHTMLLYKLLRSRKIPTFIFVNKTDIAERRRIDLMGEIKRAFGMGACDFNLEAENRERFLEECAGCDEELMHLYFENGTYPTEALAASIRKARVIPCIFGSALKCEGVKILLDALDKYTLKKPYSSTILGAKVYKIATDSTGKRLTYLKVTGGEMHPKETLSLTLKDGSRTQEKIEEIRLYSADKYKTLKIAEAGSVCAVTGLYSTYAGMGIGAEPDDDITLEPVLDYRMSFTDPSVDVYRAYLSLLPLGEEDPSLGLRYDSEAKEIRVKLMGKIQTEVLARMISDRYGLKVSFDEGRILYKETISEKCYGAGHFEPLMHYAEVRLRLEPMPRGSGNIFLSDCPTDRLRTNWQRLILSHLEERAHKGVLIGAPITDIRVTLIAGRAHPKHTEGGDFREATFRALRQGLMKSTTVLLEPTFEFTIEIPQEYIGRAMTDISNMHGECDPPEYTDGLAVLRGVCPVSTMRSYATELRSYTRGAGRISLMVGEYTVCHNTEEVIADMGYSPELDSSVSADSIFCKGGTGYTVPWQDADSMMHTDNPESERVSSESTDPSASAATRASSSYRGTVEEDKELMRIFESTYGKIKERRAPEKKVNAAPEPIKRRSRPKEKGEDYIIIDGYNLIFAWEELARLAERDLSHARDTLIHLMCNYQGFKKCNLILVFDAYKRKDNEGSVEQIGGITVVYTKERQTADAYIERSTYLLAEKNSVRVVTSDYVEQLVILGSGGTRVSALEFIKEVESTAADIRSLIDGVI